MCAKPICVHTPIDMHCWQGLEYTVFCAEK